MEKCPYLSCSDSCIYFSLKTKALPPPVKCYYVHEKHKWHSCGAFTSHLEGREKEEVLSFLRIRNIPYCIEEDADDIFGVAITKTFAQDKSIFLYFHDSICTNAYYKEK